MSPRNAITLEGADVLLAQLLQIEGKMRGEVLTRATEAGAEVLEEGMRAVAPRDDGLLASERGLNKEQSVDEELAAEFEIGPTKEAFYGRFVELGTIHAGAQPFMRPTYDQEKDAVVEEVADVLRDELRTVRGLR